MLKTLMPFVFFCFAINNLTAQDLGNHIGLNFIRPDVNRSGYYDFNHNTKWLLKQYSKLDVKWNRVAFSWVDIQTEKDKFNWKTYDEIVDYCYQKDIKIVATLGGHFDDPKVPAWAGTNLTDVLENHPDHLANFVKALVKRYAGKIDYWEILNEPINQHFDLSTENYVDKILKPCAEIIRSLDKSAHILACDFGSLPKKNREYFWQNSRDYVDIYNMHLYIMWGKFRDIASADLEIEKITKFRHEVIAQGLQDKPFWITEIGWWGTRNYQMLKDTGRNEVKRPWTGKEISTSEIHLREDSLRSVWLKDLFPKAVKIDGCGNIFLWCAMDEYEGGFNETTLYHSSMLQMYHTKDEKHPLFSLWGIFSGDKKWKKSAYSLREIIKTGK